MEGEVEAGIEGGMEGGVVNTQVITLVTGWGQCVPHAVNIHRRAGRALAGERRSCVGFVVRHEIGDGHQATSPHVSVINTLPLARSHQPLLMF